MRQEGFSGGTQTTSLGSQILWNGNKIRGGLVNNPPILCGFLTIPAIRLERG
jgi:hypothetical protein